MNDFVRSQWAKAGRALAAAESIVETDPDSAASRAYYAAFHGVTADYGGVAEATRASAVRAIEKTKAMLTALKPLLPLADEIGQR